VCECTRNGQWGSELCCFDDYYASSEDAVRMYQSDWVDDVPPNYTPGCEASPSDTPGPETQESCPFDCGVPCPPFCDSRVCKDSARLYASATSEVEVAHRLAGEAEWVSASVGGALLGYKLRQLQPQSQYEVRARARHAGGWGNWTAPLALATNGAVTAGQCIQDDAPCDDRGGEVLEIDFFYGGAGCTFAPTVQLVGGNCFANDTGVNGTGLQPCTPILGTLDAGNTTGNGSGNGSGNISASTANGTATANASCVCGAAATVTATVAEGMVVQLNVLSGGAGYTSAPTVVLSGGNCTSHAAATATIDSSSASVTAVVVTPGCITPGGNAWSREESTTNREDYYGLSGDGFAEQRTTMPYPSDARCAWRIRPPVPAGYTLRLSFDHFNTEQECPMPQRPNAHTQRPIPKTPKPQPPMPKPQCPNARMPNAHAPSPKPQAPSPQTPAPNAQTPMPQCPMPNARY
jgi:hypothetical protein